MAKAKKEDEQVKEALEAHDIEMMSRKVRTGLIEGDQPYNRELYINEIRFLVSRTVADIMEARKRLLVIKEKEGYGDFTRICEEEVGIPHSTAYRFMNAALKSGKFPQINFKDFSHVGKVYALLEAPDEDLAELEEKGVLAGYGTDELRAMSVKEMRDLIRKLKSSTDKIVKEEVKALEAEKKALIKENERLAAFDPEGKDIGWSEEQMKAVKKALGVFNNTARRFVFDDRILDHPELQVKVEGILAEAEASLNLLKENWENFVCDD